MATLLPQGAHDTTHDHSQAGPVYQPQATPTQATIVALDGVPNATAARAQARGDEEGAQKGNDTQRGRAQADQAIREGATMKSRAIVLLLIGVAIAGCDTPAIPMSNSQLAAAGIAGVTEEARQTQAAHAVATADAAAATSRAQVAEQQRALIEADYQTSVARAEEIAGLQATAVYSPVLAAGVQATLGAIGDEARAYSTEQAAKAQGTVNEMNGASFRNDLLTVGFVILVLGLLFFGLWIMSYNRERARALMQIAQSALEAQEEETLALTEKAKADAADAHARRVLAIRQLVEVLPSGQRVVFGVDETNRRLTLTPILWMGPPDQGAGQQPATIKVDGEAIERNGQFDGPLAGKSDREIVMLLLQDAIRVNGSSADVIPPYSQMPGWSGSSWKRATDLLKAAGVVTKKQGPGNGTVLSSGVNLRMLHSDVYYGRLQVGERVSHEIE